MGGLRVWGRTEIFLTVWRFVKSNVHILCFQLKFLKCVEERGLLSMGQRKFMLCNLVEDR